MTTTWTPIGRSNTSWNGYPAIPSTIPGTPRVMTVTGDISRTDYIIHFDRTLGDIVATLPHVATAIVGQPLYLKVTQDGMGETQSVTITTDDAALIDGVSSLTLTLENETTMLACNGTGWDSY